MRLYSAQLESIALRSITDGGDKVAGWLLPRLSEDHFSFDPTRDVYRRTLSLVRKNGSIPRWSDLLEDLVIPQDSREELSGRKTVVIRSRRDAKRLVERLDEYRRARSFYHASRLIARKLKADQVDLDELNEELSDLIAAARGTTDITESMVHVGDKHADVALLREMFEQGGDEFIPTGFGAFDRENIGVPRGSCWVIAATTSGGKSVMAVQVGIKQALAGARVCIVSLEMSRLEMIRRILSNITGIPLSKINRAFELDNSIKRQLVAAWKDFNARVRKNGGRLTILAPDEDLTLEDLLTLLKPYKYDNILVDYLGLLKGMDGEDQWRKLGSAARYAKRFAGATNSIITLLAQLSDDGIIKYSRTIKEHASLMWQWQYADEAVRDSHIMTIKQPKARNLKAFDFYLKENFAIMKLEDLDPSEMSGVVKEKRGKRSEEVSARARRAGRAASEENSRRPVERGHKGAQRRRNEDAQVYQM